MHVPPPHDQHAIHTAEPALSLGLVLVAHALLVFAVLSGEGPRLPEPGAPGLVQASLIVEAPPQPVPVEIELSKPEPVRVQPEAPVERPPQRELKTARPAARVASPEPEAPREPAKSAESAVAAPPATASAETTVAIASPVTAPRFDAAYLDNPPPVYPSLSRRLGEEGRVLLRVRVGPDGLPIEVNIQQPSGYPRLDAVAEQTVRQWRFVPARQAGHAVDAWVVVPISFSLRS